MATIEQENIPTIRRSQQQWATGPITLHGSDIMEIQLVTTFDLIPQSRQFDLHQGEEIGRA